MFGDAFSGIPTMGIFWKIGFGERKFLLPIGFLEERSFRDMRSIGHASWCVE